MNIQPEFSFIEDILKQGLEEHTPLEETVEMMLDLLA